MMEEDEQRGYRSNLAHEGKDAEQVLWVMELQKIDGTEDIQAGGLEMQYVRMC